MIVVVTPAYNSRAFIEQTLHSVASQAGKFDLLYHVQDGGSDDGTLEILEKWQRRINSGLFPIQCNSLKFSFASERDAGMYDAIARAFSSIQFDPDDTLTWLNSDDLLLPGTLNAVHTFFRAFEPSELSWIGGTPCIMYGGSIVKQVSGNCFPKDVIAAGLCDGRHWAYLQQEGVFFRGWLWRKARASEELRKFRLAGDWNLWRSFAKECSYVQHSQPLGIFRKHAKQLSNTRHKEYAAEIENTVSGAVRKTSLKSLAEQDLSAKFIQVKTHGKISLMQKDSTRQFAHYYGRNFDDGTNFADRFSDERTLIREAEGDFELS